MNRKERRRAKAQKEMPKDVDPPEGYIKSIQAMADALIVWKNDLGTVPKFALPPEGVLLHSGVDQVPSMARDDAARSFLVAVVDVCRTLSGGTPTPLMLECALELAGVPYERVSLRELGIDAVPMSPGGSS